MRQGSWKVKYLSFTATVELNIIKVPRASNWADMFTHHWGLVEGRRPWSVGVDVPPFGVRPFPTAVSSLSLTSPMVRAKVNQARKVLNVGTTTVLGLETQPLCQKKERSRTAYFTAPHCKDRTSSPHSSGGAATARERLPKQRPSHLSLRPVPLLLVQEPASCNTSVTRGIPLPRMPVRAGERDRFKRATAVPDGWHQDNFL